jgi:poly(beta-D-mannuronate) lyase
MHTSTTNSEVMQHSGEIARACKFSLLLLIAALMVRGEMLRAETPFVVRDPNASFLDVRARRIALQNAQTPRLREALSSLKSCTGATIPAPPPAALYVPTHYAGGDHPESHPLWNMVSGPYCGIQDVAAWGASRYLATGDPREAACVIHALLPWARSNTLLSYNAKDEMQVWFQSTWTVASLSLSVSVVRGEPTLNPAERDEVIAWLVAAAHKAISETRGPNSGTERNCHFFWRGLAATAAGVIGNDNELFTYGLRTYATAISEIDSHGAFPLEMDAHEMALHRQGFAIAPLVMIATLARRQGIDLFDVEEHKRHLSDAVGFLSKGMDDPALMKRYTKEKQDLDEEREPGGATLLAWTEFWNAHSADPAWESQLQKPLYDRFLGGNATLYTAPISEQVQTISGKAITQ